MAFQAKDQIYNRCVNIPCVAVNENINDMNFKGTCSYFGRNEKLIEGNINSHSHISHLYSNFLRSWDTPPPPPIIGFYVLCLCTRKYACHTIAYNTQTHYGTLYRVTYPVTSVRVASLTSRNQTFIF